MDTHVTYAKLMEDFAARLGVESGTLDGDSALEFGHDDLVVHIYRHPTRAAVVIDVQICEVDPHASTTLNLQRLLLLHKLNEAARFTHDAMATVTPENVLLLTRAIPLTDTDVEAFTVAFNGLLERGVELRDGWASFWKAFEQTRQPEFAPTSAIRA